jgi:hypothetical protein
MQTGVVNGSRCRYGLQTGKFDVPQLFFGRQRESGRCHNLAAMELRHPGVILLCDHTA